MSTAPPDDAFERWRSALLDALKSPENVMAWQDRRYQFAYQIGQLLTAPAGPGTVPVTGNVLYGVYVAGGGLLYVGQTRDAWRRLRDLPVGESHHLATTVPPETWERVIVVQWPELLDRIPCQESQAAEQLGLPTCGLAMEYLLQMTYRPVMTERRRSTDGGWSRRTLDSSRSRGAANSSKFPQLFRAVRAVWDVLLKTPIPMDGQPITYTGGGRVVFPVLVPSS